MGKPVVATETGYHNSIHNSHRSAHPSTTERTAGIYLPRLFLEYFRVGVERTYTYELFDEGTSNDQEDHFGLFRSDGSAKPAALALGNLTKILGDSPAASTTAPGSLAYSLSDPSAGPGGTDVHHVLLQQSDGSFYLALWRTVSEATPGAGSNAPKDASPQASPVSVTFGEPVSSAQSFRPSVGNRPQLSWAVPRTVDLPLDGDVTLLKVVPSASEPGPVPAPTPPPATPSPAPTPTPTPTPSAGGTDGGGGPVLPVPTLLPRLGLTELPLPDAIKAQLVSDEQPRVRASSVIPVGVAVVLGQFALVAAVVRRRLTRSR
jgi:hypothetical protein